MATVKLNTKEYKDTESLKIVSPRFRIKNGRTFDVSYKAKDIKAQIIDLCAFDGDILPVKRKKYNLELQQQLQQRQNLILSLLEKNNYTDEQTLLSDIDEATDSSKPKKNIKKDVLYYYREFITNNTKGISNGTLKNHKRALIVLERYAKYVLKRDYIEFSELDVDFFLTLKTFITEANNYNDKFHNCSEATAGLMFSNIRTFINHCNAKKELANEDFTYFYKIPPETKKNNLCVRSKKDVTALKLEDIEKIKNLDLSNVGYYENRLPIIRDYFLLQMYVGCRFSDIPKIFTSIKYEKDELGLIPYVEFIPEKTKKDDTSIQKMPLCKSAYTILKNCPKQSFSEILYTYNRNIYKLLKLANVSILTGDEKIDSNKCTSHLARRTHETLCFNFQPDMYLSGIHKQGSDAVKQYIDKNAMLPRLKTVCSTFKEPLYRVSETTGEIIITHEEEKELQADDIKEFISKFNELKTLLPKENNESKVYTQTVTMNLDSIKQLAEMAERIKNNHPYLNDNTDSSKR